MTRWAWMVGFLVAIPATAWSLEPAPAPSTPKKIEAFLVERCAVGQMDDQHRFLPDGVFESNGIGASRVKGTWKVKGDSVVVTAKGTGGPGGGPGSDDDGSPWNADFTWKKVQVNGQNLLALRDQYDEEVVMQCEPGDGCKNEDPEHCMSVETILLRPGNEDRALFERVKRDVASNGLEDAVVVVGKAAKNERAVTEVWYAPEWEEWGKMTAKRLAPLVGKITPKEWTWGGPYRGIVIVGKPPTEE